MGKKIEDKVTLVLDQVEEKGQELLASGELATFYKCFYVLEEEKDKDEKNIITLVRFKDKYPEEIKVTWDNSEANLRDGS